MKYDVHHLASIIFLFLSTLYYNRTTKIGFSFGLRAFVHSYATEIYIIIMKYQKSNTNLFELSICNCTGKPLIKQSRKKSFIYNHNHYWFIQFFSYQNRAFTQPLITRYSLTITKHKETINILSLKKNNK